MAKFETRGKDLYIDGKKVIRGWESFNGWYWFAIEKDREQMSDFGDGKGAPIQFGTAWSKASRKSGGTSPRRKSSG